MLDIRSFVDRHFHYTSRTGDDKDLRVDCPFCDNDTKQHMYISVTKQAVHCFRCEYSANYIKFVMDLTGFPYHRALGELYVRPRLSVLAEKADKLPVIAVGLPDDFQDLRVSGNMYSSAARAYMRKRGFNSTYWDRYGLGVADSIPYRVIIPVENGYWQGRSVVSWLAPKYINPRMENKSLLFNSFALHLYEEVVVCEGAFSAMAVGENAIAMISKEPTDERCERMVSSKVKRFIIALEPGAYGSMGKLMQILHRSGKEVVVWKYTSGDPADPTGTFIEYNFDLRGRVAMELSL